MLVNCFQADLVEVTDGCSQADRGNDGRGAGLKPPRRAFGFEVVDPGILDHAATAQEWGHILQEMFLGVEHPNARGPQHLVAAEHEEVGVERATSVAWCGMLCARRPVPMRRRRARRMISAIGFTVPKTLET